MGEKKNLKYYWQLVKCFIGIHHKIGVCAGGWIRCYDCSKNFDNNTKKWNKEMPHQYVNFIFNELSENAEDIILKAK